MDAPGPSPTLSRLLCGGAPVVALTGAGVSAESGLSTFRGAGGLWEGRRATDLATPEAFTRDPLLVWRFYAARRAKAAAAQPNAAHRSLADLETLRPGTVVITQNVDGLHERAGSRSVIRLHGSLWTLRCTRGCGDREDHRDDLGPLPPRCACGAMLRPGGVWFGEPLPTDAVEAARRAVCAAGVLLVVGTSSVVWPAAGLPQVARAAGAHVVEVNPERTPISSLAHEHVAETAATALPRLLSPVVPRQGSAA